MSERQEFSLTSGTAAEVCDRFPIDAEAMTLLRAGMSPREFLDALIEKGELVDAVQFLAHAVPSREAVWWACRAAIATASTAATVEALRAAEAWVIEPVEDRRVAVQRAAEAAGFDTSAGCAAAAAAWSGGSLAPPGGAVVPPGKHLTAHAASAAVMLAAVGGPPGEIAEAHRALLAQGLAIARGQDRWPDPMTPTAPVVAPETTHSPRSESVLSTAGLKQPISWE